MSAERVPEAVPSTRCGVCGAPQGEIRRWVPDRQATLALVIALITILSVLIPRTIEAWTYGSDTRVRLIGTEKVTQTCGHMTAETNVIRVAATNGGSGHASIVRSAYLTFDRDLEIERADLILANPEDSLVPARETRIVKWILGRGLERTRGYRKSRANVLELLRTKNVTIVVHVEETRTFGKPDFDDEPDSVPGEQLYAFMEEHTP